MIYLSKLEPFPVEANDSTQSVAEENTRKILAIINDPEADLDIAVDLKGVIYLAPYTDPDNVTHTVIDGISSGFNINRAVRCLTFDYGSSFATRPGSDTMSIKNFQIEASEKAFLFETINEDTRLEVTELYNSVVSVCWFGAEAQHGTTLPRIDNFLPFDAAINCFKGLPVYPNEFPSSTWSFIVRVPASLNNASFYFINQMLTIRSNVTLQGDGPVKSFLRFNQSSGIRIASQIWTPVYGPVDPNEPLGPDNPPFIKCDMTSTSGMNSSITGLHISGDFLQTTVPPNLDRHGIIINSTTFITNVTVSNFGGNGIFIDSVINRTEIPIICNKNIVVNFCKLSNMQITSNGCNGIYIQGDDTNNIQFEHINTADNGAAGIREEFSLQNTYINCHSATNASKPFNRSRVFYNGRIYICKQDCTDVLPTNTEFWVDLGVGTSSSTTYPNWNSTIEYLMGYQIAIGVNISGVGCSTLTGCYSENAAGSLELFNGSNSSIILGGIFRNVKEVKGAIYNESGAISSRAFTAQTEDLTRPKYSVYGSVPLSGAGEGSFGGLIANAKVGNTPYILNYQFYQHHPMFGFNIGNTHAFKGNPINFIIKATLEDNSVKNWYGSDRTFPENTFCFSSFQMPFFMREIGAYKFRLFGYAAKNPQELAAVEGIKFNEDDFVLNSNSSSNNKAIGWRCIANPDVTYPNGQWETIHYFQPAAPSANTAPTPADTELLAVLTELRDLKTKMRTAGMLEV